MQSRLPLYIDPRDSVDSKKEHWHVRSREALLWKRTDSTVARIGLVHAWDQRKWLLQVVHARTAGGSGKQAHDSVQKKKKEEDFNKSRLRLLSNVEYFTTQNRRYQSCCDLTFRWLKFNHTGGVKRHSAIWTWSEQNSMLTSSIMYALYGKLISWCFEPSQPQRITSGLNANFTLSRNYSFHESSYHKSCFFSLFIFRGHSTREAAPGRVTYFILRAYTGTKKIERDFWKNASEWTGRLEISKEEIPGSKRSMYGYILTFSGLLRENA